MNEKIIYPKYPKKPRKLINETDQDFDTRLRDYEIVKKQHKSECDKIYRSNNLDRINIRKKEWYESNSDRIRVKEKVYRDKNAEKISVSKKSWYHRKKKDPEWLRNQRSIDLKRYHERKTTDPQFSVKHTLRQSLRNNITYYLNGVRKNSVLDLIGCSVPDFVSYIENQFEPGMNWKDRNFHLDHIKPCSSFDFTDSDQVKECFHYTNFQPLWPEQNLEKKNKLDWKK